MDNVRYDQGNQWNSTQVDLSAYAGLDVTIEFVGTYGTSFQVTWLLMMFV